MTSAIGLERVSRHFGRVRALDDLSLDVAPGELLALLGPSGCGKTTFLRVVAGLERPDRGRVLIGGTDVTALPARKRPIGMVFQSYALFPNLTVAGNIRFPLDVRHVPRAQADRRVAELLELVQLEAETNRYPHQISGGQAQEGHWFGRTQQDLDWLVDLQVQIAGFDYYIILAKWVTQIEPKRVLGAYIANV